MLSILEPKNIVPLKDQDHLGAGWNYVLDYSWIFNNIKNYDKKFYSVFDVGCGKRSKLSDFIRKKFMVNVLRIDRRKLPRTLYVENFLEFNIEYSPGIIYWASSIEHNSMEDMKKLYLHSMDLLKDGGLFLATVALSEETFWDKRTKQTNMSLEDAIDTFNITTKVGDFNTAKEQYRNNVHNLKDKYTKRFGSFNEGDPTYIVGAIKKIKGEV